jgi:uncharacterized protein YcaQ
VTAVVEPAARAIRAARPAAPVAVPLRGVAALFLERQHLVAPRELGLTPRRLTAFAEDTGGIQLDTINVVERAHLLTLWSRFGSYDRRALDRMVYRRRLLFEYWAHAACLVPASHFSMWRHVMDGYTRGPRNPNWHRWWKQNRTLLDRVEDAIRTRGPLSSADFAAPPGMKRGNWWNRKPTTHALDFLWMSGRVGVHSRVHFHKHYDLAERLFTPGADPLPSEEEFRRWHLRRSLHAMGVATESDLRMYLTFPRPRPNERRRVLEAMVAAGEVVPVTPEPAGAGKPARWWALAEDVPALRRAARRSTPSLGTTLLSPFDSLLWHRERVRRLFGYDYTIEVYVPPAQRRHGYYSVPILHDGHIIGRLDPKTHRSERRLEVKAVHFEPWFARGAPAPGALRGLGRPRRRARRPDARWHPGRVRGRGYHLARARDPQERHSARTQMARGLMGSEAHCTARFQRRTSEGRALLESSELLFLGDFRLRIRFDEIVAVRAVKGVLHVETAGGVATFELGPAAERWVEKIRMPKPLIDKLGVKSGQQVSVIGVDDDGFLRDVEARVGAVAPGRLKDGSDLVFLGAVTPRDLDRMPRLVRAIRRDGAVWVVWKKGMPALKEDHVRKAGLAAGLVDVKVASFSPTHSALKLVIPKAAR